MVPNNYRPTFKFTGGGNHPLRKTCYKKKKKKKKGSGRVKRK